MLAEKLSKFKNSDAVVYALPRGGVVVGCEISKALNLPLDIIAVRKIGHPYAPEYAIGAVDDKGEHILNETETSTINQSWLHKAITDEEAEVKKSAKAYREGKTAKSVKGLIAILADDGIATGLSMGLAVQSAKNQGATQIIVAVPVASPESFRELAALGVETIVLENPEDYMGTVGAHYEQFDQVSDDEVMRLLRQQQ